MYHSNSITHTRLDCVFQRAPRPSIEHRRAVLVSWWFGQCEDRFQHFKEFFRMDTLCLASPHNLCEVTFKLGYSSPCFSSKVHLSMLSRLFDLVGAYRYSFSRVCVLVCLFEGIFVDDCKMLVSKLIEVTIDGPSIAINGTTSLDVALNDRAVGRFLSISHRIENHLVALPLHKSCPP